MSNSYKLDTNKIIDYINRAKYSLNLTLDELENYIKITPKNLVDECIVEHYKNKEFLTYQCYHTNKIEGSRVTLSDTGKIIDEINKKYGLKCDDRYSNKDINEVRGFVTAYRRSARYIGKSEVYVPIIKDLHMNLMKYSDPSIAGIYRTCGATIYGCEDFIKFVSPDKIDVILNRVVNEYNYNISRGNPVLFEACKFKVNFINIHPFSDGNGRISRLLLNCMLISGGMLPIIITDSERMGYKRAMQIGYQAQVEGINNGYLPLLNIVVNCLVHGYQKINKKYIGVK